MLTKRCSVRIVDAMPTAPNDRSHHPVASSSMPSMTMPRDGHGEAPVTWMGVYQIADNFELDELRVLAKNKLFKFE
ncbi:hypothetical protein BGW39_011444 [Mortierella sp. 14UC]|nr:hypothetical protein BGW39_011444 [Mortierella sp. 14UC]